MVLISYECIVKAVISMIHLRRPRSPSKVTLNSSFDSSRRDVRIDVCRCRVDVCRCRVDMTKWSNVSD